MNGSGQSSALTMTSWDYAPDLVAGHLRRFRRESGIPVELSVLPYFGYPHRLEDECVGGRVPDVYYNFASSSRHFVEAGWAQRLDGLPGADALLGEMFPSSRSHYQDGDGRLISVPYFSAVQALFYNRAHLAAAGITGPPSTFADAYRDSKRLRELGISQTPYTGYWAHQVIEQAFVTYLLAAGVTPFDKDGAPVFADDGRSIELLEWWQAMCTEGLAQASVLTDSVDVVAKHMAEGRFTFMQSQHYWVKAIRGSDGPEASNVYLAERMHGAADIVLQIGEVIQVGDAARAGAWDLARFYGWRSPWTGDRATLRAWAIDAGLVAPYPALFEDAEIRRHFSAFVDPDHLRTIFEFHSDTVPARELPWYAAFKEDCGTRLHALLAGAADPRGTLEGIASDARKRASDHRRMHKSP